MAEGDERTVRLAIPATARYLRLARLTAAGIAGDLGFSLESIEDLRVAVGEVCAICIEDAGPDVDLELVYHPDGTELVIEGTCANGGAEPDLHPVARELLSMTADDYDISVAGEAVTFRLLKRSEVVSA